MDTPVADWVLQTTDTYGTGTISLGPAKPGYASLREALKESGDVWYSLLSENGNRECGIGYFNSILNTLARNTVHATLVNGVHTSISTGTPKAVILQGVSLVACSFNAESWKEFITDLQIGNITTLEPGEPATVTKGGTHSAPVLNFGIPKGDRGPQGPQGLQGIPGLAATISVGLTSTGAPGTEASVTNTGNSREAVFNFVIPAGAKGDKGNQGEQGLPGNDGAQGAQGIQGIQGDKGEKGDKGDQGLPGLQGPAGPMGLQGFEGPVGPQGPQGIQGPTGADGADGTSVVILGSYPTVGDLPSNASIGDIYHVTADNNFYVWNGTIWDNLGPLQGPQGPEGPQGPAGPNRVSTSTASAFTGLIKGANGFLELALVNTDYLAPSSIGDNVQGYSTTLSGLAGLTITADKLIYSTGVDTFSLSPLTAFGRSLIDDASASAARTTLGATTVGSNLFTLTNPSAITFPRINADNTISALDAATFRTAIGAGAGTVTSVGLSVPTGLSVSGTPITSSGTITISLATGYSIPTTTSQTNWDAAYTDRNKWDGGSTGLTAATGRTSLGATTVGSNLFTLTNPSAVTFPRINADNTVSALDAATFRTAIGAGTSSTTGTVTSVGGTGTVNGLTLTGTVTGSGNLTLGGTLNLSAPPAIGGTTPSTGAFTDLSYTGTFTGGAGVINIGSGQIYKDASGNVGIGTNSPGTKLDINGNIALSSAAPVIYSTGILGIQSGVSSALSLYTAGGVERFRIEAGGQVVFRQSSNAANTSVSFNTTVQNALTLDVGGNLLVGLSTARTNLAGLTPRVQIEGLSADTARLSILRHSDSPGTTGSVILAKTRSSGIGGNTTLQAGDTIGYFEFQGADGTNLQPSARIQGQIDSGTVSSTSMPGVLTFLTSPNGSVTPTERLRIDASGTLILRQSSNPANTSVSFNTTVQNALTLDVGGRLLVGTTSPTLGGQYNQVNIEQTTANYYALGISNSAAGNVYLLSFANGVTNRGYVWWDNTAGVLKFTGQSSGTYSDVRLKEVKAEAEYGLADILKIETKRFNWKRNGKSDIGVIAQDLHEIIPEAVEVGSDGSIDPTEFSVNDVWKVREEKLVIPLIKAVQELHAEIEQLKQRIN